MGPRHVCVLPVGSKARGCKGRLALKVLTPSRTPPGSGSCRAGSSTDTSCGARSEPIASFLPVTACCHAHAAHAECAPSACRMHGGMCSCCCCSTASWSSWGRSRGGWWWTARCQRSSLTTGRTSMGQVSAPACPSCCACMRCFLHKLSPSAGAGGVVRGVPRGSGGLPEPDLCRGDGHRGGRGLRHCAGPRGAGEPFCVLLLQALQHPSPKKRERKEKEEKKKTFSVIASLSDV